MKKHEMGDAIARACEWTFDGDAENDYLYRTKDGRGMYNPAADLNAMHEAEKVLSGDQQDAFWEVLEDIQGVNASYFDGCHANAAQRAEAFLKCLNLWHPAPHDGKRLNDGKAKG